MKPIPPARRESLGDAENGSVPGGVRILALLAVSGVMVIVLASLAAAWRGTPGTVEQPIAFNHKIHIEQEDLACTDCHTGAMTRPHAGFPGIRVCYDCHQTAEGTHPDEPKVREYAKRGEEIPFVKVNRNVGHVYFSHRAHTTFGQMECEECHGDMASIERPVTQPTRSLQSMDSCIACHKQRDASLQCVACHT